MCQASCLASCVPLYASVMLAFFPSQTQLFLPEDLCTYHTCSSCFFSLLFACMSAQHHLSFSLTFVFSGKPSPALVKVIIPPCPAITLFHITPFYPLYCTSPYLSILFACLLSASQHQNVSSLKILLASLMAVCIRTVCGTQYVLNKYLFLPGSWNFFLWSFM